MSLPQIAESLAIAYLRGDHRVVRGLLPQLSARLKGERGERVRAALNAPPRLRTLNYWQQIAPGRSPWAPPSVNKVTERWLLEVTHADALYAAGESVRPLLLSGPTRCGKTSIAMKVAREREIPLFRLSVGGILKGTLGSSSRSITEAFDEARSFTEPALWLMDEIDAIGGRRSESVPAAADKELNASVSALLTGLDSWPASSPLIATTNLNASLDLALLARFSCVSWPEWEELGVDERAAFIDSHGGEHFKRSSYADAVERAREERVDRILLEAS